MEPNIQEQILAEIRAGNELLARFNRYQRSWWLPLRNGILIGLGTVLGATIVVSMLIRIVKPFEKFGPVGAQLERIANDLESHNARH